MDDACAAGLAGTLLTAVGWQQPPWRLTKGPGHEARHLQSGHLVNSGNRAAAREPAKNAVKGMHAAPV